MDGEIVLDQLDERPGAPVDVVLAMGGNLGPVAETLRTAVHELTQVSGLEVTAVSPLARTAAVGGPDQPDFLNAVVLARTTLAPREVLRACQGIENAHGRQRSVHWGPRTLDIDAAQAAMHARGLAAKAVIEGPPRRACPILLRQTSFKALEELVHFPSGEDNAAGTHTARFGEIEQRGLALTPKGRALYDALLAQARDNGGAGSTGGDYMQRLQAAFAGFPDDHATLRREGLGYYRYVLTDAGRALPAAERGLPAEVLIERGLAVAEPIVYEDFLPVSAAGIFQSNLGGEEQRAYAARANREAFEQALGATVADEFAIYERLQAESLAQLVA